MKFGKRTGAALMGAVMMMAAPGQAGAEVYVITIFGQVTDFYDQTKVFGPGGSGAYTLPYKAVHLVSIPSTGGNSYFDGTNTIYYGGADYGDISPVRSSITIRGRTVSDSGVFSNGNIMNPNEGSVNPVSNSTPYTYDILSFSYGRGSIWVSNGIYNHFSTTSQQFQNGNLLTRVNYILNPTDSAGGRFQFLTEDLIKGVYKVYARGSLNPQQINIKPLSAGIVPEPSTWALMILGFGGIGAAMRRRSSMQRVTTRVSYSR